MEEFPTVEQNGETPPILPKPAQLTGQSGYASTVCDQGTFNTCCSVFVAVFVCFKDLCLWL